MPVITLKIKHSGKTYDLEVEPESSSGGDLKTLVFSLTGVPNERQKIIVKGGQLKDDADLSKLGFKNVSGFSQAALTDCCPPALNTQAIALPCRGKH